MIDGPRKALTTKMYMQLRDYHKFVFALGTKECRAY